MRNETRVMSGLFLAIGGITLAQGTQPQASKGLATLDDRLRHGPLSNAGAPQVPVIGYLSIDARTVRPIAGAAGAIALGEAVGMPPGISRFFPAPGQQFGITARTGSGELGIAQFGTGRFAELHSISNTTSDIDRIDFSPSATSAVAYSAARKQAVVLTGLPANPQVAATLDLSGPGISVTSLAVPDDGTLVLAGVSNGTTGGIWAFQSTRAARQLTSAGVPAAMRFFVGKHDAILADSGWQQIVLLAGVDGQPNSKILAGAGQGLHAPSDIEISFDQLRVWTADAGGSLFTIHMDSAAVESVACPFTPASLTRLAGGTEYLVTSRDGANAGVWAPEKANAVVWRVMTRP